MRSGMSAIDLYFLVHTKILKSRLLKLLFALPVGVWEDDASVTLSQFLAANDMERLRIGTPAIVFEAIARSIFLFGWLKPVAAEIYKKVNRSHKQTHILT